MSDESTPSAARTRITRITRIGPTRRAGRGALPASKQRDPFATLYNDGLVLAPPYARETLARLYDISDALLSAVAAMETNISGFGWQLVPVDKDRVEKEADAAAAEKRALESFVQYMNVDGSLVALRRRTRVDQEVYGDGYWEVLRDASGKVSGVAHMRAHFVRKGPLDPKPTEVDRFVQEADGTWTRHKQLRRFRCFVQIVGGVQTWFKTLGDPRPIRADNGKVDYEASPDALATEVLNFTLYAPDSAYGKPRWRGASDDVAGRAAAAEVNSGVFDNKGIPPFLILVQGALLGPSAVEAVKEHFESTKGRERYNAPLIIEAEGASSPTGDGPIAPVKIDVKDLTEGVQKDALFGNYRVAAAESIAMAFRIPRIIVGGSRDYNRATADAARSVAEEQVFGPERAEEDEIFNREILPLLGYRYWRVRTNPPPLLDETTLATLLRVAIDAGILTPAQAGQVLGPLLGLELTRADAWAQIPSKVLTVLLDKGWVIEGVEGLAGPAAPSAEPEGEQTPEDDGTGDGAPVGSGDPGADEDSAAEDASAG